MYQVWSKSIVHKDAKEGSITISLRNFVGEEIKNIFLILLFSVVGPVNSVI
jgi:hypothetical protein